MTTNQRPRPFDRVLIIMFENMYRSYVMQNEYMRSLASRGIDMANYFGVMHPSQTNYIASIAGELCNVTYDDRSPPLPQRTVVDLLEAKGLDWRAYMDGYPEGQSAWKKGLVPQDQFPYVIKHNPFSSFANILDNSSRWAKIVDQNQFLTDAAAGKLPAYSWFTPNMWHDGHYSVGTTTDPKERAPALVNQQAIWLRYFFGLLKFPGPESLIPPGTLVVVTYDESDFEAAIDASDKYTYDGPNQIYTVLLGSMIKPGVESQGYNHYSLLRTIEENFELGSLEKNDRDANYFQFLWGRSFAWHEHSRTSLPTANSLAAAIHKSERFVAFVGTDRTLHCARHSLEQWGEPETIAANARGPLALIEVADQLLLLYATRDGIEERVLGSSGAWSPTRTQVVAGSVQSLAAVPFDDGRCLMLVWADDEGQLRSLVRANGKWSSSPTTVGDGAGFRTRGGLCLGRRGTSLYCIYEASHGKSLMVVDYNTAAFNVVDVAAGPYAGPYDDTSIGHWSPSAFPVAEFRNAPNPVTPGEPEPVTQAFAAAGTLACATLDGVLHLVHGTASGYELVTETFSVPGLLTPRLPISYAAADQTTTSNGYGTLAEAGWSDQETLPHAKLAQGGSVALCATARGLWLVYAAPDGRLHSIEGGYTQQSAAPISTAGTPRIARG